MYVCLCKGVNDRKIREAVSEGCHSMRDVCKKTGAGSQCGKCIKSTREIINQEILTYIDK